MVEELWDHYLKFHLKGTVRHTGDSVEEEYETDCVPVFQVSFTLTVHKANFMMLIKIISIQQHNLHAVIERPAQAPSARYLISETDLFSKLLKNLLPPEIARQSKPYLLRSGFKIRAFWY